MDRAWKNKWSFRAKMQSNKQAKLQRYWQKKAGEEGEHAKFYLLSLIENSENLGYFWTAT